jgi:hypothetical protein
LLSPGPDRVIGMNANLRNFALWLITVLLLFALWRRYRY